MDLTDNEINQLNKQGGGLNNKRRSLRTFPPPPPMPYFLEYQGSNKYLMSSAEIEARDYLINQSEHYCRGLVSEKYTAQMLTICDGFVAVMKKQYLGFILFKPHKTKRDTLDLKVLCTIPRKLLPERGNFPIGKMLLEKMEEYAKKNGYTRIVASAVNEALPFYEKNNWNVDRLKNIRKKMGEIFKEKKTRETPIIRKFGGKNKKKKSIRKHSGINQQTGRLKKGYKYSGKKLKSGLSQIIRIK